MCKKQEFYRFIENTSKRAIENESLKSALQIVCNSIVDYYPGTQISFAENIGKRISYILGAGKELFKPSEIIRINERYVLVMQNFNNVSDYEKNAIGALFKNIASMEKENEEIKR
ncbi:hypothetical protein OW763_12235 [Clostridium aestuarii]|uniref:Uncharacterized protein n=1 Tax=Clostridium aestuarii TaxID=338193 RepID=A0ABT4D1K2_9CLOT|nr:hypothetical protein [Clostridium aestuarii]MCY6485106.1 hypothetical protein [Clostridium aestuarii]